jgi:endo-1,4-beta-xylanase
MKKHYVILVLAIILSYVKGYSQNFISNGGFESRINTDWNLVASNSAVVSYTETSDAYEGTKALKVDVTTLGNNRWDIQVKHKNSIGWGSVSGQVYVVSYKAKASNITSTSNPTFTVILQNATYTGYKSTVGSLYKEYKFMFIAKENDLRLKFQFNDPGTFYLDDISITEYSYTPDTSESLKQIAEQKGKYIGNIIGNRMLDGAPSYDYDSNIPNTIFGNELNAIVTENQFKMKYILPTEPADIHNITIDGLKAAMNQQAIDNYINYALTKGLHSRGHTMVWYNSAPDWLVENAPSWTAQQLYDFTEKYIKAFVSACDNQIDEWDVVNEAINDNSSMTWRPNTWYDNVSSGTYNGETSSFQLFFEKCFVWAREAVGDNVMLLYNDYNIERKGSDKSNRLYNVISKAVDNGAPINGVGFQSHFSENSINNNSVDAVIDQIRDYAALGDDNDGLGGLKVHITELDITVTDAAIDQQIIEDAYYLYASKTLAEPNVDELLLWGISDKDHWLNKKGDNKTCYVMWNGAYEKSKNPGPYSGIYNALASLPDAVFPPAGLSINWGDHGVHLQPATDEIISVVAPTQVTQGETVTLNVEYEASTDRDIEVSFQDVPAYSSIATARISVAAGSGTVSLDIVIPSDVPVATDGYQFQTKITTINGGWAERFDNLANSNIDVINNYSDDILSVVAPAQVAQGETVTLIVEYEASTDRDIEVIFQDVPAYSSIATARISVAAGAGTVSLNIVIPSDVPVATGGYQFQTKITTINGGWAERFDNLANSNINVINNYSDDILSVVAPAQVAQGETVTLIVEYEASTGRDIEVIFQDVPAYGSIATARISVAAGAGTVSLDIVIPSDVPVATGGYQFQTKITTINGGWAERFDNLANSNIDVINNYSDDLILVVAPAQVTQGETVTLNVEYSASTGRDIEVSFQDVPAYHSLATARISVAAGSGIESIDIVIPSDVPVATDGYKFQTKITTINGGWAERFDNFENSNIDVLEANVAPVATSSSSSSSSSLKSVEIKGTTAHSESVFEIYPNPAKDFVKIHSTEQDYYLSIYDIMGREVKRYNNLTGSQTISISSLMKGIYIVRMISNNGSKTQKLITE